MYDGDLQRANLLDDFWSFPDGFFTSDSEACVFSEIDAVDLKDFRVVLLPYYIWGSVKSKLDGDSYNGIVVILGGMRELSTIITHIDRSKVERLIACRTESVDHEVHRLLLILNYTDEKRPYREARERYTYCPLCGNSSKDYGGKKHHYHSDGTWIRDVWNAFVFKRQVMEDPLFLSAIRNLFCVSRTQRVLVLGSKPGESSRSLVRNGSNRQSTNGQGAHVSGSILNVYENRGQRLINGDSLEILPYLASVGEKYDLIFVDPPYNVNKKYRDYNDRLETGVYNQWCERWAQLARPLLEQDGFFVIVNTPLNILNQLTGFEDHYVLVGDIVWDDLGVPTTGKMQATYYSIVFLAKEERTIDPKSYRIRDPRYCKRDTCKGNPESYVEGASIWGDVYRTRQKSRRWGHPCSLPEELVIRVIDMVKGINGKDSLRILDFFNGIGTTTMASVITGCHSTGIELSATYFEISRSRLDRLLLKNPDNGGDRNGSWGKKKTLQRLAAFKLQEADRTNKGYTVAEQVEWLIKQGIIQESELGYFFRPGELLKGVGKGGAPGENHQDIQMRLG